MTIRHQADLLAERAGFCARPDSEGDESYRLHRLALVVEELARTVAELAAIARPEPEPDEWTAAYTIPGTFTAVYRGNIDSGEIERFTFMPAGSDAGYFGPPAEYQADYDDDDAIEDAGGLDVKTSDGPFWQAVQHALDDVGELGADEVHHRVPIHWQE